MLWTFPFGLERREHNVGSVGTSTPGTSVTTGGTSSTKGTPAELIASTAFDTFWVSIFASNYSANATSSMGAMDILIGAATEEVLIPNLLMGFCGTYAAQDRGPQRWDFPLYIPAGSRLAVQAAGERTSTALRVQIHLFGGSAPAWPVATSVTTYGIGTVPNGTAITAGASGAQGSWTQITASTSRDHIGLVPSFQVAGADTSLLARHINVGIGYGSATEELLGECAWTTDSVETMSGPYPSVPIFRDIPSGSRLTMRASGSGTVDGYQGALHALS